MQALTDPTLKNVGMATIAPAAKEDAFKIIDTWDKANISMTLEDEDDTAVIYMAPASKNDNTQECIVVVNQKSDPQLMLIYLEGDENLLDKINIGGN